MIYRHYFGISKQRIRKPGLFLIACTFAVFAVIVPAGAEVKSVGQQPEATRSITGHPKGNSELLHANGPKSE